MKCTNGKPPMLSIYDGRICCDTRARAAQADLFFKECLEIADRGKDGENESQARIQRDRLRVDTRKWMAARLAPKKYGDHISHDVKGPGPNFQPAILITVDGQPPDEFARQLAYDEGSGRPTRRQRRYCASALSRNFAVELGHACAPWIGLSRGRLSTSIQNDSGLAQGPAGPSV